MGGGASWCSQDSGVHAAPRKNSPPSLHSSQTYQGQPVLQAPQFSGVKRRERRGPQEIRRGGAHHPIETRCPNFLR